jgi:hypothetical protein
MSRPPIIQADQSYRFLDYFKLKLSQEILAYTAILLL